MLGCHNFAVSCMNLRSGIGKFQHDQHVPISCLSSIGAVMAFTQAPHGSARVQCCLHPNILVSGNGADLEHFIAL